MIAAVTATTLSTFAQPRSAGFEISPFRFGGSYLHTANNDEIKAIHVLSAGIDMTGLLMQRQDFPGVYADYSCDFNIVQRARRDLVFNFLLGPGVDMGYASDINNINGFFFGGMVDIRSEFNFRELPISLGIIFKPTLALQVYKDFDGTKMSIFKHGLINSCLPQVTLSYRFHSNEKAPEWNGAPKKEYEYNFPLVTFGVEWGYIAQFHVYSHFNYIAEGGYRVDYEDYDYDYKSNAHFLGHVGVNVSKHLNVSVYGGYQGITRRQRIFPVTLRTTALFGQPEDHGRWLAYIDGGIGLKGSKNMFGNAIVADTGFGYRIGLTRETKLDLLCSLKSTYWHPNTFSESIQVRRSNEVLLGLCFGAGISF